METKLITKTIKELADEYDCNVDQLHRTISRCNKLIIDLKEDNKSLKYGIELERWARARAEKVSETNIFIMLSCVAVLFVWIAKNILIG